MRVLVACEESQRVCISFRELGHEAFSCDKLPCSGGHPEWHFVGDCRDIIDSLPWDLVIAHPPCTRLCNSGQRWMYYGDDEYQSKKSIEQRLAIGFFMYFTHIRVPLVAIENPIGIMSTIYRKPDQIYQPWMFGDETDNKSTCLWLKGLPSLVPDKFLDPGCRTNSIWRGVFNGKSYSWNDPECSKMRSKTPWGVARAMAKQWGCFDV